MLDFVYLFFFLHKKSIRHDIEKSISHLIRIDFDIIEHNCGSQGGKKASIIQFFYLFFLSTYKKACDVQQ